MGNDSRTLSLNIMERDYRVNCPEGAEQKLRDAARFLDQKMSEIRDASAGSGKVPGIDRIAVIAALNISHQLLEVQALLHEQDAAIERLTLMLDETLQKTPSPDL
ncbi:cell division protein ZapA [Parathalassolituus penaei]|uniref:Cell division protein ZapA n=1 Tax=Parathalassolituus penaei TaxID=2997323 RepID=A0A9X3EM67_9GAMM|nr:cell division protein ZapA [Parathalassolituus penaei]MCY0965203.1 cell division protein ZapA [Parathalassolituus penaei]